MSDKVYDTFTPIKPFERFCVKKHSKIIKIRYEETNDYHDSHGNDYADGGIYALDQGRF